MIISHRHKFVFIKTRKTAGTSIQQAIEKHCGPDDVVCQMGPHTKEELEDFTPRNEHGFRGHDFACDVCSRIGGHIWENYFTFTFVRNTWDKIVSQFWYDTRRSKLTFPQYLYSEARRNPLHLSNWFYYTDSNGKDIVVDFIGSYENLQDDYDAVCRHLDIHRSPLYD